MSVARLSMSPAHNASILVSIRPTKLTKPLRGLGFCRTVFREGTKVERGVSATFRDKDEAKRVCDEIEASGLAKRHAHA